jgi:hypothetical protein
MRVFVYLFRRAADCRADLSGWWLAAKCAMSPGEEDWIDEFDAEDYSRARELITRADKTPSTT